MQKPINAWDDGDAMTIPPPRWKYIVVRCSVKQRSQTYVSYTYACKMFCVE